ncbi:MAG: hypothetical protein MK081_13670 [Flavobacteriales bacterium]|nr:hypothetical protein [Flavobacteriales bacterium]
MSWEKEDFLFDIKTLNRLITRHEIKVIGSELSNLESNLECNYEEDSWSHVVKNIELVLEESISGTIPVDIEEFHFFLTVHFIMDEAKDCTTHDPFYNGKVNFKGEEGIDAYSLQIEIEGHSLEGEYTNTWHLDRHITGGGVAKVVHPFYHFQNGGHKIEEKPVDTGKIVFTGAPRIPHPPMDIILGFHFIVNNFFNKNSSQNISNLLGDTEYEELITRAQNRMWKPYYNAFNGGNHNDYTIDNITPLYTVH